jgi:hypothetical protein
MIRYERLEQLAASNGVGIDDHILREDDVYNGLIVGLMDGSHLILINRHRPLSVRIAALAEELGHYFRSVGDLRDLSDIAAAKSEALAHAWSIERLLPQPALQTQLENGNGTAWELAEATGLPEPFIREAATYHARRQPRRVSMKALPDDLQESIRLAVVRAASKTRQSAPRIGSPDGKPIQEPAPVPLVPSFAEQREAIYRRGKELYGIEKDAWIWNILFDLWFNRDSKLKYTTIPTHVFKEYGKAKLGTMLNRIFRDYFISIGREP